MPENNGENTMGEVRTIQDAQELRDLMLKAGKDVPVQDIMAWDRATFISSDIWCHKTFLRRSGQFDRAVVLPPWLAPYPDATPKE
jgi:hypothetical protein